MRTRCERPYQAMITAAATLHNLPKTLWIDMCAGSPSSWPTPCATSMPDSAPASHRHAPGASDARQHAVPSAGRRGHPRRTHQPDEDTEVGGHPDRCKTDANTPTP